MKSVLGDRKFIFLYTTTHPIGSCLFENAIQLGRADSFRFLGPLSNLYQIARSASRNEKKILKAIRRKDQRAGNDIGTVIEIPIMTVVECCSLVLKIQ